LSLIPPFSFILGGGETSFPRPKNLGKTTGKTRKKWKKHLKSWKSSLPNKDKIVEKHNNTTKEVD